MSEPKSPKPMPSVAEINAYLEQSAARTKMRLPLAKGNALPTGVASPAEDAPPDPVAAPAAGRALPVSGKKALPTQPAAADSPAPSAPAPGERASGTWAPFADEPE
jgi:hypothetical protein